MTKYKVSYDLMWVTTEVEADSEEEAKQIVEDTVFVSCSGTKHQSAINHIADGEFHHTDTEEKE